MPDVNNRRSPRIVKVVEVLLGTDVPNLPGHTRVLNRHGALVMSPRPWTLETRVHMLNPRTGQSALCRVAWEGGEEASTGVHKLGLEFLHPSPGLWGDDYPEGEGP